MRIWPLRSLSNLSITIIGATGVGLVYYSVVNENKFSNSTVVTEAINILNKNSSVRNLIGNPVQFSSSYSNTYETDEKQQYFNFYVKGSKSKTTAELNSTKMKVEQLNAKISSVREIEVKLEGKNEELNQVQDLLKKAKKSERKTIEQNIQFINKEITQLNNKYQKQQIQKIQLLKKYYIPEPQLQRNLMKNKLQPKQAVSPDQYLHGIDGLSTNITQKSRIVIIPSSETNIQQTNNSAKAESKYKIQRITNEYLQSRLKESIQNLSQAELESYSKHKNMATYGRYNEYRIATMLIASALALFAAFHWHVHRVRPVAGSLIAHEVQKAFMSNQKVLQLIKNAKKTKKDVKISDILLGGRTNNKFDYQVDIQGLPGAQLKCKGTLQKQGLVKFELLELNYSKENKKIDLLL